MPGIDRIKALFAIRKQTLILVSRPFLVFLSLLRAKIELIFTGFGLN